MITSMTICESVKITIGPERPSTCRGPKFVSRQITIEDENGNYITIAAYTKPGKTTLEVVQS
jgi:hypothetical protein